MKDSFPMRERSSFLVHFLRRSQKGRKDVISSYFSCVMLIVLSCESISIPRYVIFVDGPSSLSRAIGMPRWWNTAIIVSSSACAVMMSAGLTSKKSSE